jgi:hypothetical protein
MQAMEKFVPLSVPVTVPMATHVNNGPSLRKQEGRSNVMSLQHCPQWWGDQWHHTNIYVQRTNLSGRQTATGHCFLN